MVFPGMWGWGITDTTTVASQQVPSDVFNAAMTCNCTAIYDPYSSKYHNASGVCSTLG